MTKNITVNTKEPVLIRQTSIFLPSTAEASISLDLIPTIITGAGEEVTRCFLEFFTTNIENRNTRLAYARAIRQFLLWCEVRCVSLQEIQPMIVTAYREAHSGSPQTIKQHLAAIRMLFDWLVIQQMLPMNPAASVKGPKYSTKKRKTPVLSTEDARKLLNSINTSHVVGLRDRALIGIMIYSFARVSAVVSMRVEDYYQNGKRWWIKLHEKGGKFHEVPVHHAVQEYLDTYINEAGMTGDRKRMLFRTTRGKSRYLTQNGMNRTDVLLMVKRRAQDAGLPDNISCHTFRATGITAYLQNGGTIEHAQAIAAHESPWTTKLYDRTNDTISLDEIERIVI